MNFSITARTQNYELLRALEVWCGDKAYLLDENVEYRFRNGGLHLVARNLDTKTKNELEGYLNECGIECAVTLDGLTSAFIGELILASFSTRFGIFIATAFWLVSLASMIWNWMDQTNTFGSTLGFALLNALLFIYVFTTCRQDSLLVPK